uniref:Uncharacterized protein n=1 Tax=viral metagenome TaxID=1070528 RepID=A0A6C0IWB6_9ZZZZ
MNPEERLHWEKHYKQNLLKNIIENDKRSIVFDYDHFKDDDLEKNIKLYSKQNNRIISEHNIIDIDTIKPTWGKGELHLCECELCFPTYKADICDCEACNGSLYDEKIMLDSYIEPCNYINCAKDCIKCEADIYISGFRQGCVVNTIKILLFEVENEDNKEEKLKLCGEIFKLLSEEDGQWLLKTETNFRIVVKQKLKEFYLIEGEKVAYKWYRDVFKERLKI